MVSRSSTEGMETEDDVEPRRVHGRHLARTQSADISL